jgi:16S rRNA (uracil1498-N3)-methyltransferase
MSDRLHSIRLFVAEDLSAHATIQLDADVAHYLGHVLRRAAGDTVILFNGRDGAWLAEISEIAKKSVQLLVQTQVSKQISSPDVWLIFVPIKRARLDFMAQKATELGVSKILPVQSAYGQMKRINDHRLEANAIEAAEQTERLDVPEIAEFQSLTTLLSNWPDDRALIFCDEGEAGTTDVMPEAILPKLRGKPASILIGPEGGFSPDERRDILALPQSVALSLGPRILRSDTAALSALSLYQAFCGDWRHS